APAPSQQPASPQPSARSEPPAVRGERQERPQAPALERPATAAPPERGERRSQPQTAPAPAPPPASPRQPPSARSEPPAARGERQRRTERRERAPGARSAGARDQQLSAVPARRSPRVRRGTGQGQLLRPMATNQMARADLAEERSLSPAHLRRERTPRVEVT